MPIHDVRLSADHATVISVVVPFSSDTKTRTGSSDTKTRRGAKAMLGQPTPEVVRTSLWRRRQRWLYFDTPAAGRSWAFP